MFSVQTSRILELPWEPYFFWDGLMYHRWSVERKALGKWAVFSTQGPEVYRWFGHREAYGVMDDFGNLVKVA